MAANVLTTQYDGVPRAWPAVLSALAAVAAVYGAVREAVR